MTLNRKIAPCGIEIHTELTPAEMLKLNNIMEKFGERVKTLTVQVCMSVSNLRELLSMTPNIEKLQMSGVKVPLNPALKKRCVRTAGKLNMHKLKTVIIFRCDNKITKIVESIPNDAIKDLRWMSIPDDHLDDLLENQPNITTFHSFTSFPLSLLANKKLKELVLKFTLDEPADEVEEFLKKQMGLKKLTMWTELSDASLAIVGEMKELEELELRQEIANLNKIEKLPKLRELIINGEVKISRR